jgi:hypothetical protein
MMAKSTTPMKTIEMKVPLLPFLREFTFSIMFSLKDAEIRDMERMKDESGQTQREHEELQELLKRRAYNEWGPNFCILIFS